MVKVVYILRRRKKKRNTKVKVIEHLTVKGMRISMEITMTDESVIDVGYMKY